MAQRNLPFLRHRHRRAGLVGFALAVAAAGLVRPWPSVDPVRALSPLPAASAGKPVADETYRWRPVAIGGGGFITGLSSDRTGETRVARSDVYGAYIWQADADRWVQMVTSASMPVADRVQDGMNEGVYEIVVAPSDPKRIYMAIKGRVYRSDDRGAHWTVAGTGAPFPLAFDPNGEFRTYGPFLTVDPTRPDLLFFGNPADGLWRSADAGVHWSRIESVPRGHDLRDAPGIQSPGVQIWYEQSTQGRFTGRIWAASAGNGLFVSRDDGLHFAPLTGAGVPQPLLVKQGCFAPDGSFYAVDMEGQAVWKYQAGQWTELTGGSALPRRRYAAVAVNPQDGRIFLFDEGGQAYRSGDNGKSWWPLLHGSQAGAGDPPWLRVSDQSYFATGQVRFDPAHADRLWVGSGMGVFFADAPTMMPRIEWRSQTRGIEELVANDAIQPPGQSPMFAALDFGIHVKDDLDAFSTTYGPKERVLIAAQQMDWSPSRAGFVVTNASDTRSCCAEDGDAVLAGYSLDGGHHWTKFATLPQPPGTDAHDPWRMAFGTIAVSAGDIDNIVWEPSFDRSPFFTHDRGRNWTRVILPGEILPNTGSHARPFLQRKTLAADRVAPGTFYLVHSGGGSNAALQGVWRTEDGGAHWRKVFKGEVAPESRFAAKLRAVPGHAGHLFFTSAVTGATDTRLRRSIDGGTTWRALADVDHVDDIAFGAPSANGRYPTLFVSGRVRGRYGIWRSVDEAASWQRLAEFPLGKLDQVTVLEADKQVFGRVYVGYEGSGWAYGEPAPCAPATADCVAVR